MNNIIINFNFNVCGKRNLIILSIVRKWLSGKSSRMYNIVSPLTIKLNSDNSVVGEYDQSWSWHSNKITRMDGDSVQFRNWYADMVKLCFKSYFSEECEKSEEKFWSRDNYFNASSIFDQYLPSRNGHGFIASDMNINKTDHKVELLTSKHIFREDAEEMKFTIHDIYALYCMLKGYKRVVKHIDGLEELAGEQYDPIRAGMIEAKQREMYELRDKLNSRLVEIDDRKYERLNKVREKIINYYAKLAEDERDAFASKLAAIQAEINSFSTMA